MPKIALYLLILLLSCISYGSNQCSDLFGETVQKNDLTTGYLERPATDSKINLDVAGKQSQLEKMILKLNQLGIKVSYLNHFEETALGAYSSKEKTLYINRKSLARDDIDFVLLHEIRHAISDLRSSHIKARFERLFLTSVEMDMLLLTDHLPGIHLSNPYKNYFALDEILAHRQSAAILLRELQKSINQNKDSKYVMSQIKHHALRIHNFIESFLQSVDLFTQQADSFGVTIINRKRQEGINSGVNEEHVIQINEQTPLSRLNPFSVKQNQQALKIRFRLKLTFEESNYFEQLSKDLQKQYVLAYLSSSSAIISTLAPAAHKFKQAIDLFNHKNRKPMIRALQDLNTALSDLRETLNK